MRYNIEEKLEAFVRTLDELKTNETISNLKVFFTESKNPSIEIIKNKKFKEFRQPRLIYKSDSYY